MPADLIIALLVYVALTAAFLAVLWPFRGASPIFWYPVALALMATGIFLQISFLHPSDETHIFASFFALISFSVSAISYSYFFGLKRKVLAFQKKDVHVDDLTTRRVVYFFFIVSLLLTLLYFSRTGTNMIVLALTSGIQDDYSTIRLSMYAGERYTAAGYFNQFKNFLLPLTSALIVFYINLRSKFFAYVAGLLLAIICLLAVAGTGQRTYLVFSFCATFFGFVLLSIGRRKVISLRVVISGVAMFVGFSMMTALYKETEGGIWEPFILSFERIFYSQQWAGLVAFQFIYDRPIVWFQEWTDSIVGILPGHRGSILANEIHDFMFLSFRGTAPPTLIGSAYHNGGLIAVVLGFSFLGFLYAFLYDLFLSGRRSPARCFGYGALFFYLTTFFVGPIKYPLDNGVAAFWLFLFMIKIRWRPVRVFRRQEAR